MKPPSGGPRIGPVSAGIVSQAIAETSSLLGVPAPAAAARPESSSSRPCLAGTATSTKEWIELAVAQATEPSTKTPIAMRKMFLAPNRSHIQPEIGMKMASATR